MAKAKKDNDVFEEGDDSLMINMDEVEEAVNELIAKGKYQAIIDDLEFAFSASSNKPMWKYSVTITDGDYKGRKLFGNMSFSEKALPITKGQLMDIAPDVLSSTFDPKAIAEEGTMVGKKVTVNVKHEKYEGENRARIGGLAKPKGGGDDFLDD